jgi:hypothetical protein
LKGKDMPKIRPLCVQVNLTTGKIGKTFMSRNRQEGSKMASAAMTQNFDADKILQENSNSSQVESSFSLLTLQKSLPADER